ncbi:MAG TPA: 6-phosphogluconolactonase [Chloroflexota bacterium]|nr:6-phosphogluconolactonase [Chloroflexota bacterium]
MDIERFPDRGALTGRAAGIFIEHGRLALADRGVFLVALSGGSTPRPLYEMLSQPPDVGRLEWNGVQLYFGDERVVPPEDPSSNFRMVRETLLASGRIPEANVHRIEGELGADQAARQYDAELRALARSQGREVPRLDLVLLGLGPDGHTASLFPGTDVLNVSDHLAAPVSLPPESSGYSAAAFRVTLTFPVINAADLVLFLVAGEDKRKPLQAIEEGDESLPAARVRPATPPLWLVTT